jgi:hypothetical protein
MTEDAICQEANCCRLPVLMMARLLLQPSVAAATLLAALATLELLRVARGLRPGALLQASALLLDLPACDGSTPRQLMRQCPHIRPDFN